MQGCWGFFHIFSMFVLKCPGSWMVEEKTCFNLMLWSANSTMNEFSRDRKNMRIMISQPQWAGSLATQATSVGQLFWDCFHGLPLGPPSEKELFVLWSEDHYSALCQKNAVGGSVECFSCGGDIFDSISCDPIFCNRSARSMRQEGHVPQTLEL